MVPSYRFWQRKQEESFTAAMHSTINGVQSLPSCWSLSHNRRAAWAGKPVPRRRLREPRCSSRTRALRPTRVRSRLRRLEHAWARQMMVSRRLVPTPLASCRVKAEKNRELASRLADATTRAGLGTSLGLPQVATDAHAHKTCGPRKVPTKGTRSLPKILMWRLYAQNAERASAVRWLLQ